MNKYLEKVAEKTREHHRDDAYERAGKATLSFMAGGIAATPLAVATSIAGKNTLNELHRPGNSDMGTVRKFMKDNDLRKHMTFNARPHAMRRENFNGGRGIFFNNEKIYAPGPAYVPNKHGRGFVMSPKGTNPDLIMHELGHAKDFARHGALKRIGMNISRTPGGKAPFELATVAALTNDKTRDYAPVAAAVPGALMLREEAAANYHAYKGIKAHKGAAPANKFLKRVVSKNMLNYGLAAATPVAGAYVAKKIMDRWSPRQYQS